MHIVSPSLYFLNVHCCQYLNLLLSDRSNINETIHLCIDINHTRRVNVLSIE
jgi:hypothetical protein